MSNKKSIASKMVSKEYTNTRCGHCGKFGHHHSEHKGYKEQGGIGSPSGETMKDMGGNHYRPKYMKPSGRGLTMPEPENEAS